MREKPLVQVEWDDCCDLDVDHGWLTEKEAKEVSRRIDASAFSVGYLVSRDKRWLILAGTRTYDPGRGEMTYGTFHQIPGGWVRKIRRLR